MPAKNEAVAIMSIRSDCQPLLLVFAREDGVRVGMRQQHTDQLALAVLSVESAKAFRRGLSRAIRLAEEGARERPEVPGREPPASDGPVLPDASEPVRAKSPRSGARISQEEPSP